MFRIEKYEADKLKKTSLMKKQQGRISKDQPMYRLQRFYLRIIRWYYSGSSADTSDQMDESTSLIFLMKWPSLYFFMVEFAFLMQSFYLAIYFTQILPLAVKIQNVGAAVGWSIALIISAMIGFGFLRLVISKSVILNTTCYLNKELVNKVIIYICILQKRLYTDKKINLYAM